MANKEHLARLMEGGDKWNAWKMNIANALPDLSGANLSGAHLSGAHLNDTNLNGANLSGAHLNDANLNGAGLSDANLNGANLSGANLSGANLDGAILSDANLNGANLNDANLNDANLNGANLSDANLNGANLSNANLNGANLSNANLYRVQIDETIVIDDEWRLVWQIVNQPENGRNLSGANLSNANLSGVNLRFANLNAANLCNANLRYTVFSSADLIESNLSNANLREADFNSANLSKANLSKADFQGADIRGSDFRGADLQEANLDRTNFTNVRLDETTLIDEKYRLVWTVLHQGTRGLDLHGADFCRTDLSGADLSGANFSEANFSEANLSGADLSGADFRGANLRGANFSEANLSGADLSGADFRGANLRGVNFSEANLSDVNLSGANLSGARFRTANLSGANLQKANLSHADLSNVIAIATSLLDCNLTCAVLTGACIQDWHINSSTLLHDVICDHVYLKGRKDKYRGGYSLSERRPSSSDSNFAPGEFTKLFQQAIETVDLIFTSGVDGRAFSQAFQELRTQFSDEDITIQSIEKKRDRSIVIRLEVSPEADKAEIEKKAKEIYERDRKQIEDQYREQLSAKDREIEIQTQKSSDILEILRLEASRTISVEAKAMVGNQYTNNLQGSNIANFANELRDNASQTASQFSQTIGQNADEIVRLMTALREQAQQFSEDLRDDAIIQLDDLQQDLSTPARNQPKRITRRIVALLTFAGILGTTIATATEFANNVLELADKFEIPKSELMQHVPTHLLPTSSGQP